MKKSRPPSAVRLRAFALALLWTTLNSQLSTSSFAQGPLTPPGPPAPAMKSLDQIASTGIEVNSTNTPGDVAYAFIIAAPGSYYLSRNIAATGNGIRINSSGVSLDLNGFIISSPGTNQGATGIALGNNVQDIAIANGRIVGATVYDGTTYSGTGFSRGFSSGTTAVNVRVSHITISNCALYGIYLGSELNSTAVDHCNVRVIGSDGITAGNVTNSTAHLCGGYGIAALSVANSTAQSTGPEFCVARGRLRQRCVRPSTLTIPTRPCTRQYCRLLRGAHTWTPLLRKSRASPTP